MNGYFRRICVCRVVKSGCEVIEQSYVDELCDFILCHCLKLLNAVAKIFRLQIINEFI